MQNIRNFVYFQTLSGDWNWTGINVVIGKLAYFGFLKK